MAVSVAVGSPLSSALPLAHARAHFVQEGEEEGFLLIEVGDWGASPEVVSWEGGKGEEEGGALQDGEGKGSDRPLEGGSAAHEGVAWEGSGGVVDREGEGERREVGTASCVEEEKGRVATGQVGGAGTCVPEETWGVAFLRQEMAAEVEKGGPASWSDLP